MYLISHLLCQIDCNNSVFVRRKYLPQSIKAVFREAEKRQENIGIYEDVQPTDGPSQGYSSRHFESLLRRYSRQAHARR